MNRNRNQDQNHNEAASGSPRTGAIPSPLRCSSFFRLQSCSSGGMMSSKRFLYLCVVLAILLSGVLTPLFQPAVAVAASPDMPSNVLPADGATAVSLTPILQSSAFSDSDVWDTHSASQWQITTTPGGYSNPVFSSVTYSPYLTSTTVPVATLSYSTTYYWHVRHQDSQTHKHWSSYSDETSFTTVDSPTTPPTVYTDDATGLGTTTATLNGNLSSLGTASSVTVSFVWGTSSGSYPNGTTGQAMTSTGAYSFDLASLTPGTTYYCKAKAVGDGTSYGGENDFTTEGEGTVTFADPNLEAAIRAAISKPTGDIYQADLDGLTSLDASGLAINDLTGLEHCTSLTVLHLFANQIGDISPLSGLTNLGYLSLQTNQISDISPLAGLTTLTDLYLYMNQITDISPLAGLTNLTDLRLGENQISDISPLASLTNLTTLHVLANQVSDISPLTNLTSLTDLSLRWNQISDIEPLVDNPGIGSGDTLDLRTNPLSSTSIHTYVPALEGRGVTVYSDAHADQPPNQPINTSPTGSGISLTPTLESSAFSDPDAGDTHAASWWQVTTTAGDYSSPVFDSNTDASHLTSSNVPSLAYSTTYYWRVRHQDIHGLWSSYSNETSFTTVDSPTTPPTVYNDDATGLGTTTATLHGNLSSLGTASSVTVSFVWGTRSGSLTNETTGQAMTSTGAFYFDLASLTPGTTYHYKAKAVGDGTSYGAETSFAATTAPPALTTNDASSITTNSGRLNGDLTSLGTASSVTVSFVWGTSSGSYPNESTSQAVASTGAIYSDLASLTPGTTYYYKAKAVGHGDPVYGVEKSFTTGQSPEVETLDPVDGKPKQDLTVTITGANLDGATGVSFGSGITVDDFSVVSSSEITAEITIDAKAAKGTRDVSVTTAWGTATKTDGFSVIGGGGGICSGGALATPGAPSEMTTTLVALGLLLGLGYLLVRRGTRNKGESARA